MTHRSFVWIVTLGLGGATLAAVAAAQPWLEASTRSLGLRTATADGSDVAPLVLPLALVGLAAWGATLALRRRARRVLAVLGVVCAAAAGVAALVGVSDAGAVADDLLGGRAGAQADITAWPALAVAGCALSAVASVLALLKAHTWPEMSSRYDAERPDRQASDADLWRALDDGRDPTV